MTALKPAHTSSSLAQNIVAAVEAVIGKSDEPIALHEPVFTGNEEKYVQDCLQSGWVSSAGAYVDAFETKLAEFCETKFAILTVNGTASLHATLFVHDIKVNEEVLMPALTFVATANAISYLGAIPHFIEADETTLGVDAQKLDNYLQSIAEKRTDGTYNKETGRKIAALLPVHIYGHPCDIDGLTQVANSWGLHLIFDGAESLGSAYKGASVYKAGACTTLSFNGNKIITTGGGGAILTDDEVLAKKLKHITTTAKVPHTFNLDHDEIAFNYRMPNLNAALGLAQLEQLPEALRQKRELAMQYREELSKPEGLKFLSEPQNTQSNYWLSTISLNYGEHLNETLETLKANNYLCRPTWTPMHKLPMYEDSPRMDLSVTENLVKRLINLPSSPQLLKGTS